MKHEATDNHQDDSEAFRLECIETPDLANCLKSIALTQCVPARGGWVPASMVSPADVPESLSEAGLAERSVETDETDDFIHRFFVARQGSRVDAREMLLRFAKWRNEREVDNRIIKMRTIAAHQAIKAAYPNAYYGTDKRGRPVFVDRVGHLKIHQLIAAADTELLQDIWIQSYEHLQQVILPACSLAASRRITKGVTICDMDGLGLSHLNFESRRILKLLIGISQDYYPELLDRMFIVNPPKVFSFIWRFISPLLDEKTAAKITVITGGIKERRDALLEFIDEAQLPKFLCTDDPDWDEKWMNESRGPWRDVNILNQLRSYFPHLPDELLGLTCAEPLQGPSPASKIHDDFALVSENLSDEFSALETNSDMSCEIGEMERELTDLEIEELFGAR